MISDVIPFGCSAAAFCSFFSTMRTSLAGTAAAAAAVAACLPSTASAWVVNNGRHHHVRSFPIAFAAASADETNGDGTSNSSTDDEPQSQADIVNMDNVEPQAVYGVSYIGGDPCGSKYNDDPFDAAAQITKPGMPDDAKERIRMLAEQMKRKQEEEKKAK